MQVSEVELYIYGWLANILRFTIKYLPLVKPNLFSAVFKARKWYLVSPRENRINNITHFPMYTGFERLERWMAGLRTKTWKLNKGWSQIRPEKHLKTCRCEGLSLTNDDIYGVAARQVLWPWTMSRNDNNRSKACLTFSTHWLCVFACLPHFFPFFLFNDTTTVSAADDLSVALKKKCCLRKDLVQ